MILLKINIIAPIFIMVMGFVLGYIVGVNVDNDED